ncbi:MAG TPA: hypothetical protein VKZ44_05440, partial [Taishania sp.]|nr:hypothetical protein [Taishania sp.]
MLSKLRIQLFEKHNKRQIITLIILSFFLFSLEIHSQTNEKLKAISIDKKDISTVPLDSTLKETSSLYYDNRLLWSNNDDKDNRLYGINLNTGSIEQIVEFNKLKVVDWEETQQDSLYYFLGDFGNNGKGNRQNLMFFKIRKSDLTIDTIQFHYPEQTDFSIQKSNRTNFDCEAFIIHDSNIYLFTKEWKSTQTSLYKIPTTPGKHVAQKMGSLNVRGLITGATINPDKTKIILS